MKEASPSWSSLWRDEPARAGPENPRAPARRVLRYAGRKRDTTVIRAHRRRTNDGGQPGRGRGNHPANVVLCRGCQRQQRLPDRKRSILPTTHMKIIIIGASGTLGKKITAFFEKEHEVIRVGSKSGDIQANMTDPASIEALFKKTGPFDALISAAGEGHFGP